MTEQACRECRRIVEGQVCPICNSASLSREWSGYVVIIDPKESNKSLGEGDRVQARIIEVSLNEKEPRESKIRLTMRQTGLGRLEWLEADTAEKEDLKAEAK